MINKPFSYSNRLLLVLAIKSCIIILFILFAGLRLGPDEAQYWTWSKALDLGYYSKPPGIAWQIGLGTLIFGNTESGIRIVSVLIAFAQAFAIYHLALACQLRSHTAFWSGIIMAFCPVGIFGSIFAITDGGLLLFWTVACILLVHGLKRFSFPNPIWIGLCIAAGALFKWSIYIFWIYAFLLYSLSFPFQNWYKKFFLGASLSLLGLLPSIYWNWSHDWATFRHVGSTLNGGHGPNEGNFFEFIGSQALLLSPIFFGLLLCAYKYALKTFKNLDLSLVFCLLFSCVTLCLFSFLSLFQKLQGNWILFAYPTGIVLIGWYCCEVNMYALKWLKGGSVFSIALSSMILCWPSFTINYRKSPFKHNLGWYELNQSLQMHGYDPDTHFLVSDKYQTTSILSFYSEGQKRAYFLNLEGNRKNQFSYWPDLQSQEKKKSGFFIWIENTPHLAKNWKERRQHYLNELQKYFEEVEPFPLIPLITENEQIVKGALFFKCRNCKNKRPDDSLKY